jgi:succinoglycan biosynthesis transport protein ExoP
MNFLDFDLYQYWSIIKKRKITVLLPVLLLLITVTLVSLRQPKMYRAVATLEVGAEIPDVAFFKEVVSVNPTNWWTIGRYYETQYKIIRSNQTLTKAAERLQEMGLIQRVKGRSPETYAGMLRSRLGVNPVAKSRLVNITYDDTSPVRAAKICNTISQIYIEENLNRKLVSAKQAVDWLSQQLRTFQEEKRANEQKLREFKAKHKIVSLDNPQEITVNNLAALSESLNKLTNRRIELEARYQQLKKLVTKSKGVDELFGIVESELITKLKEHYVDQEREVVRLSFTYGERHPKIIRARKELDQIKSKIRMEVTSEVQRLKTRFLLAKSEEEAIRKALENTKMKALDFESVNYQLQNIVSVTDTNQKFYVALSEKLKEADLSGLVKSNNIRIIDKALPPGGPIGTNLLVKLLLATLAGLIGGIGFALLWEHLDATIKTQEDVENFLKLPFLGMIPFVDKAKEETSQESEAEKIEYVPEIKPKSTTAEFYRNIRTNLTFVSSHKGFKTFMLTSASPQEGKTATSLNLAITLAQLGQRVLLIDADLRRPSMHHLFGVDNLRGFSNLLIDAIQIEEAVLPTGIQNLSLIPSGPLPPNPAELLSSDTTRSVIQQFREKYDRVIIDTSPVVPISDALVLSQLVDGVIYVVFSEGPHRTLVSQGKKNLEKVEAPIIGTILNGVRLDQIELANRYYYRYGYHSYLSEEPSESESPSPSPL